MHSAEIASQKSIGVQESNGISHRDGMADRNPYDLQHGNPSAHKQLKEQPVNSVTKDPPKPPKEPPRGPKKPNLAKVLSLWRPVSRCL